MRLLSKPAVAASTLSTTNKSSKSISRRQALVGMGVLGLGTFLPNTARAAWGDIPVGLWPFSRHYKILEVFLYGGLSAWETFHVRAPNAVDRYRGLNSEVAAAVWNAQCSGTPMPGKATQFFANATDQNGNNVHEVHLGPFTAPLWRPDILGRMRMLTMQHELEPHEAAIPYAMTGHRLGRPKFAGTGAAIQRRFQITNPGQTAPFAYVCVPGVYGFPTDNILAASATGVHGGDAKPLTLRVGQGSQEVIDQLLRTDVTPDMDQLLNVYRAEYKQRLRWQGTGTPLRSKGFSAYDASSSSVQGSATLRSLLATPSFNLRQDMNCSINSAELKNNQPGTEIRLAAHLLTRPMNGARYVCAIDSGLEEASGGGGYDTHSENIPTLGRNLWNTLSTLKDVIQDPTLPVDPNKISLDDTLIVLSTEFGRTPAPGGGQGRDHHPGGYLNILIGGPVGVNSNGRKLVGNLNDASGYANPNNVYSATDLRAALLLAAGVFPLNPDSFAIGELTGTLGAADETSSAALLRQEIFGV